MIFKLFPCFDRWCARRARHDFFTQVARILTQGPTDSDRAMGQADFYHQPLILPFTPDSDSLQVIVNPEFHGNTYQLTYSIWQTGTVLRVGALFDNESALAPLMEGQQEINQIWPNTIPETQDREGKLMYQWIFDVEGFLDRWSAREAFVSGLRHMHFRLLRILHDGTA